MVLCTDLGGDGGGRKQRQTPEVVGGPEKAPAGWAFK